MHPSTMTTEELREEKKIAHRAYMDAALALDKAKLGYLHGDERRALEKRQEDARAWVRAIGDEQVARMEIRDRDPDGVTSVPGFGQIIV